MADARKLSSMDASFLYLETPEMPMHVGSMAIFRLPADYKGDFFEDFKAMIASRLHIAPILKALIDTRYTGWLAIEPFVYKPDGPSCAARAIGYVQGLLETLE